MRYAISLLALAAACTSTVQSPPASSTPSGSTSVERAVQRTTPLTKIIRRAFAAGTRDSSGRPGRNYWQLRTDYTINVRLEPSTQRMTGTETVAIKNNSPDTLRQI